MAEISIMVVMHLISMSKVSVTICLRTRNNFEFSYLVDLFSFKIIILRKMILNIKCLVIKGARPRYFRQFQH